MENLNSEICIKRLKKIYIRFIGENFVKLKELDERKKQLKNYRIKTKKKLQ